MVSYLFIFLLGAVSGGKQIGLNLVGRLGRLVRIVRWHGWKFTCGLLASVDEDGWTDGWMDFFLPSAGDR